MTIKQSLAQLMEDNGFGTRGDDLFLGAVPQQAPTRSFWILGGGGSPVIRNQTGEKSKNYLFTVFMRNTDAENVDETLQSLEEFFNSKQCFELEDYTLIEIEASGFQTDGDIDIEGRTLGSIEVSVTTYQSE